VEKVRIGGVLQARGLASIGVTGIPDRPGVASRIFLTLANHRINVEFIVHAMDELGKSHVTFCVDRKQMEECLGLLHRHRDEIGCSDILHHRDMAIVSIFGPHFRERHGIAGTFFNALGSAQVNILAISTSVSTVSCLIGERDLPCAVSALSQAFELPGN
jgi:aspartokinase